MNLGLGTLSELKAHLLNAALESDTAYDGALAALGRGVSARFERACNREFPRVVAAVHEFDAARDHVILPRYPVESLTALELRATLAGGWIDQGAPSVLVNNLAEKSGLVDFGAALGARGARARLTYTGGFWIDLSGDGFSGTVALAQGNESAAVVFPTIFGAAPAVTVAIIPPTGGLIVVAVPSAITPAGFTALLGTAIPAAGYTLQWTAAPAVLDPDVSLLSAAVALTAAEESKAVVFAAPFAAAPRINVAIIPPAGGTIILSVASEITAAGFTALLGYPVPAAGYTLQWTAAPVTSTAQPAGSTARPDDLFLAWLLQCERIWSVRDKLGLSLAGGAQPTFVTMTLAALELVPEVKETLRGYTRHNLT